MYKDVAKRILAFMMMVCMLVTLVEWPTPVWAAGAGAITYGSSGTAGAMTLGETTVAAVFATSGTEVLNTIKFEASVEEGTSAKATVSYYTNVQDGNPESGTRIFAHEMSVQQGTNTYETGLSSQMMSAGSSFAIVISLEGASLYTADSRGAGTSYVKSNGSWRDVDSLYGRCAAIRAFTYGVRAVGSASASSSAGTSSYAAIDAPSAQAGTLQLNKTKVTIAELGQAEIYLNGVDTNAEVQWYSEDDNIVQVTDGNGTRVVVITGRHEGRTNIVARYDGAEYPCEVTVTKDIGDSTITLNPESPVTYNGTTWQPVETVTISTANGEVTLNRGEHYDVDYLTVDGDPATPGVGGAFVNAGTYKIWVRAEKQSSNYDDDIFYSYSGRKSVDFVIEQKDINASSIKVTLATDISDWADVLEGKVPGKSLSDLILAGSVVDNDIEGDRHILHENVDYELKVNEDKTGIVIVGKGNYTGEKQVRTPQPITDDNTVIRIDTPDRYIYTGRAWEPTISVIVNGETLSSTDYMVEYEDNINVTTAAKIIITGTGEYYYGTAEKTFEIFKKDIGNHDSDKIAVPVEESWLGNVGGSGEAPTEDDIVKVLRLTYNGVELSYSEDKKDYEIESIEQERDETGPTGYWLCTLTGQWNFGGTRTVRFVYGNDIAAYIQSIQVDGKYTYNGLEQKPYEQGNVHITWNPAETGGEDPVLGTDYVIEYADNIDAGTNTAKVIVRGINKYAGYKEASFTIDKLDINSDQGRGSVSAYFVRGKDEVTVANPYALEYSPNMEENEPEIRLYFTRSGGERIKLEEGIDYSLGYSVTSKDPNTVSIIGTHTVTITGDKNFTGTRSDVTYQITACDLRNNSNTDILKETDPLAVKAVLDREIYDYTGVPIAWEDRPQVTITHRSRTGGIVPLDLDGNENFTIEYLDKNGDPVYEEEVDDDPSGGPIAIATYTVRIKGKNNYAGQIDLTYDISSVDIQSVVRSSNIRVTSSNEVTDYTGPYFAMLWFDDKHLDDDKNNKLEFELYKDGYIEEDGVVKGELLQRGIDYEITNYYYYTEPSRKGEKGIALVEIKGIGRYFNTCTIPYLLAQDISGYSVVWTEQPNPTYSRKAFVADDYIRVYKPGSSAADLVVGTDVTVSYKDSNGCDQAINAGEVEVIIDDLPDEKLPSENGCFRFRDNTTKQLVFTIQQKSIVSGSVGISYEPFSVPYTGKLWDEDKTRDYVKVTHSVLNLDDYMLVEGTDYTLDGHGEDLNNTYPAVSGKALAYILVKGKGNYTGTLQIDFNIKGRELEEIVSWKFRDTVYNGSAQYPALEEVVLSDGTKYTISGDNADGKIEDILEVDNSKYKDNTNAGTGYVTVYGKNLFYGGPDAKGRDLDFQISPLPFKQGDDVTTSTPGYVDPKKLGIDNEYTYLSVPILPQLGELWCVVDVVSGEVNGTTPRKEKLVNGTDFDVQEEIAVENGKQNVNLNAGTGVGTVTLVGKGNYTGTYQVTFDIIQKSLGDGTTPAAGIEVLEIKSQVFTGMKVAPIPVIQYTYDDNEEPYTLKPGIDYQCEYEKNDGPGEATVKITGIGNFTGGLQTTFQIGQSIADTKKISVDYYGLDRADCTYDGSYKEPQVVVWADQGNNNRRKLVEGTDYIVHYENNKNANEGAEDKDKAKIIVEGIGTYAGEVEKYFTIYARNLNDKDSDEKDVVSLELQGIGENGTMPYTGSPVEPKVVLTDNGYKGDDGDPKLKSGTDYTVTYTGTYTDSANHTDIGTVTVTVMGTGNYTGTRTATFEITRASIGDRYAPGDRFRINAIPKQVLDKETGKAEPIPVLTYNFVPLTPDVDYTYTWENNTEVGTGTVVITGIGNYTGTVRKDFEILESIADADVEITGLRDEVTFESLLTQTVRDKYVTGDATSGFVVSDEFEIKFDDKITVVKGEDTLVQDKDYKITYDYKGLNNSWVGTVLVTITGIGTELAGSVTKPVMVTVTLPKNADGIANVSGLSLEVPQAAFNGGSTKGQPKISYYGKSLLEGTHYIVSCSDNSAVTKEAKITITGNTANGVLGEYAGTYEIIANSSTFTVEGVEASYPYRGVAIEPVPTVKAGGVTLSLGKDYTLDYGTNVQSGNQAGYITVKGTGSYDGNTTVVYFDILPWDVTNLTINLTPSSVTYTGQEVLPTPTLLARTNAGSYTIPESDYTWAKTPEADNTNKGSGSVRITGTSVNVTGTVDKTFTISAKSLAVPPAGQTDQIEMHLVGESDEFPYTGSPVEPKVAVIYHYGDEEGQELTLREGTDYTLSYSNNTKAGTATVRVTGTGNYSGYRELQYTITTQDMSNAEVNFPDGTVYSFMGTGIAIRPTVEVVLGGVTLTEKTDYTLSYEDNTAVGTAKVTITGAGSYTGSLERTFTITRHSITAGDVVIQPIDNQAYTGSPITPDVTITLGSYTLKLGTDYSTRILSENNTEPGEVSMGIYGEGGFSGETTVAFRIAADISKADVRNLQATRPFRGSAYTVSELTSGVQVYVSGNLISSSNYYFELKEGSDGMSAGSQTLILRGNGEYGGSKELAFTITQKNITENDVVMSGFVEEISGTTDTTQHITLKWGSITLVEGTDYTVEYTSAGNTGVQVMTVTGQGNYTGTITKSYTVKSIGIGEATVELYPTEGAVSAADTYSYTGTGITPFVKVTLGGVVLRQGTDYKVTYSNNINVGVATVLVEGIGSYTGEVSTEFLILGKSITLTDISAIEDQIYTGKDLKPTVTVKDSGTVLIQGTNYTLMYDSNRLPGTGVVTVAGKGNYSATARVTFKINPYTMSAPVITSRSSTALGLSWTLGGTATGYEIWRQAAGGNWEMVEMVSARTTSYTDKNLTPGTTYTYRIRAYVRVNGEPFYGKDSATTSGTTTN